MKFANMEDAKRWVKRHRRPIEEYECPMFDLPNPTLDDLVKCGIICMNHWGCHTFRHIYGTRDPDEPIKVLLT